MKILDKNKNKYFRHESLVEIICLERNFGRKKLQSEKEICWREICQRKKKVENYKKVRF